MSGANYIRANAHKYQPQAYHVLTHDNMLTDICNVGVAGSLSEKYINIRKPWMLFHGFSHILYMDLIIAFVI